MSEIIEFYNNKSIFVTGATGFLGKSVIEKCLRSCSGIEKIYYLVRPSKNGVGIKQRIEEYISGPIFSQIRANNPEFMNKLIPIEGDISKPMLGISETDRLLLIQNVSVVIHSAATVKFNEKLLSSIKMNVKGTMEIMKLCAEIKNLASLVHISTAYVNCETIRSEEVIPWFKQDPFRILKEIESLDSEAATILTSKIIGSKPNTYTFTKALAERVLYDGNFDNLPIAVVRPSIVTAAWKEPFPGWIDNINGPTGLMIASAKGVLRTFHCRKENVGHLVPVDVTASLILAVGWFTATNPKQFKIYNCCTGDENPVYFKELEYRINQNFLEDPVKDPLWYPCVTFDGNKFTHEAKKMCFQLLPAFGLDFISKLSNRKPVMVKFYGKLEKTLQTLEIFTTSKFQFPTTNMMNLYGKLGKTDREIFNFNVRELDWKDYMYTYCQGVKKYLLKEENNECNKIYLRKLYQRHIGLKLFVICTSVYIMFTTFFSLVGF